MDKKQAEVEKELLKHEQKAFRELKKTYNQALDDIKGRVLNLQNRLNELNAIDTTGYDEESKLVLESMKRSKVYQLEFQKSLEKEISAVLDVTKQTNVTNIQTFLSKMYQDSYLGIQYDLNSKGIPYITPINPSLLVETVNKKTAGMSFAQREVANMSDFKKTVKAEISRGIANASSYSEIAQQLSMKTNEALYKSKRIVRTEGTRVSTSAKLTSIRDEIEKGADLVKVWDSTLDHKTRPLHAQLDQQWKEVNEPFEVDGVEVQGPGMFGDPGQDCNCRCVILSVPRWDIDDTVVKIDNETGELIETKNYEEWKQGYYRKIAEEELKASKRNYTPVSEKQLEHLNNIVSKLSRKQQSAVAWYTGDGYEKLNNTLRYSVMPKESILSKADAISEAIGDNTIGEDTILYRGIRSLPSEFLKGLNDEAKAILRNYEKYDEEIVKEVIKSLEGIEYTEKSFMSTTISESTGKAYATDYVRDISYYFMELNVDKEVRGLYVDNISLHKLEKEFLIDKNYTVLIEKAEYIHENNFKGVKLYARVTKK